MKIDWKKKLTSRKFWIALCNFIGMLVMACGYSNATAERITALILAGGTCIAYIIGEGMVDAANAGMVDYELPEGEDLTKYTKYMNYNGDDQPCPPPPKGVDE